MAISNHSSNKLAKEIVKKNMEERKRKRKLEIKNAKHNQDSPAEEKL